MSDYETIRYQRQGDVGTLTLARPAKRNAQNPLMWQELARLGAALLPDAEGTKVGLTETRYGLLPDMGATVRLPRIVGESRARELILLGEVIDAAEALRIGLASRVVTGDDLDTAAAELAERLAAQPPLAVRGARRAIDAAWHRSPEESIKVALEEQIRCLKSEDFSEALQAMAERRSPQWRGR